jgi:hypothetical protein
MPVSLDDDQLAIVMAAAQPLEPTARHAFLIAVAAELAKDSPELGPGSIHRLVREMQPRYFDAPRLATTVSAPRAGRAALLQDNTV